MSAKNFNDRVYDLVRQVPEGKVVTYGQVALMLGHPRAARAVGHALNKNPYGLAVPCHRVLNREGRLAAIFYRQRELLEDEGVEVSRDDLVDLYRYQWDGVGYIETKV